MNKEHKYYLGKCDYLQNGRANCPAYITWELSEDGNFKMCGEIWNHINSDLYAGGQCVKEVAALFPDDEKAQEMVKIWQRWHLNDMQSGCEHQRAWKWNEKRIPIEELPNSNAGRDENGIMAMWIWPKEHKRGLLTRKCLKCGYRYGTAWLKEELPQEVIDIIKSWNGVI